MQRRLIADLIDREQWMSLDADVKGDAYEGLLEKNAEDVKNGRRPIFHAARPDPGHRGRDAPGARLDHFRPGLRNGRFSYSARTSTSARTTT